MLPLPFALADDNEQIRIVFEGDTRRVQYVAPMPGYLGSGGPQVQLLELVRGDDGDVLQFSHALLQGFEQDRLFDRDPVILLEAVASAGFEYLGRNEEGELTGWTSSWDQANILPAAVRLQVEFSGDLNLDWPDLVAAVRVDEVGFQGNTGNPGNTAFRDAMRDLIKGKGESK
jgi:general secretion pathway protein J